MPVVGSATLLRLLWPPMFPVVGRLGRHHSDKQWEGEIIPSG